MPVQLQVPLPGPFVYVSGKAKKTADAGTLATIAMLPLMLLLVAPVLVVGGAYLLAKLLAFVIGWMLEVIGDVIIDLELDKPRSERTR